jgi:rhodanese-related sulfurtransferase
MDLIDRDELKAKLDRGDDFKLMMVMGEWAFKAQHIPGSINMNSAMEARHIDREAEIVVYCTGGACIASRTAYTVLKDMGFTRVRHYPGGLEDWSAAGLPLEGEHIGSAGA